MSTLMELLALRNLEDLTDDDLEMIELATGDKADNYIIVDSNIEFELEKIKAFKVMLDNRKKSLENSRLRLRKRLYLSMANNGIQNIKGQLGTVSLRKNKDVLIINDSVIGNNEVLFDTLKEHIPQNDLDEIISVEYERKINLNKDKLKEYIEKNSTVIEGIAVLPQESSLVMPKAKINSIK